MKNWIIERNLTNDKVIEILKKYTTPLNDDSNGFLKGLLETEIINNRIYYYFYVNGKNNRYKLFSIELIDLEDTINFSVNYFNSKTNEVININKLEEKIDEIIKDDKIGNLINYLIKIEKIENSKQ